MVSFQYPEVARPPISVTANSLVKPVMDSFGLGTGVMRTHRKDY